MNIEISDRRRAAVLVVYEAGNFPLMLSAADCLRQSGWKTTLFSPYFLPQTAEYIEVAREQECIYVHECTSLGGDADAVAQLTSDGSGSSPSPSAYPPLPRSTILSTIRTRLAEALLGLQSSEVEWWRVHYEMRYRKAYDFLSAARASLLVLPEENVERDSAEWVRAIQLLGGRAAVLTYGAVSPEEGALAYFDHPEHRLDQAKAKKVRILFSRWCMRYRDRDLVRLPLPRVTAMEELGLAPRRPWIVNTGLADKLFVESESMADTYAAHAVPRSRISVVGTPMTDRLRQSPAAIAAMKTRLFGSGDTGKILLCAIPPDQYPNRPAPEYASYETLIDGWIRLLSEFKNSFAIVISPHPTLGAAPIETLKKAGFNVVEGGVAAFIPACDVYLASVSSTIKWAVGCGKPVVNYDCYRYDYDELRRPPSVQTVFSASDARAALRGLASLPDATAAPSAAEWDTAEPFCTRFLTEVESLGCE